jgi:hypothetical protein
LEITVLAWAILICNVSTFWKWFNTIQRKASHYGHQTCVYDHILPSVCYQWFKSLKTQHLDSTILICDISPSQKWFNITQSFKVLSVCIKNNLSPSICDECSDFDTTLLIRAITVGNTSTILNWFMTVQGKAKY